MFYLPRRCFWFGDFSLLTDVLVPAFLISVFSLVEELFVFFFCLSRWFHRQAPHCVSTLQPRAPDRSLKICYFFYNLKETVKCSHNLQYWLERHFTGSNGTLNNL